MRTLIKLRLFGFLVFSTLISCRSAIEQETKQNILVILTDQQNINTLKAYGNELIQAPGLNGLADQAFVFQNAYVTQPVCAPSRASITTGLYPHTHGVIDNNRPLARQFLTLPELLGASYRSAYIGKWHLGDEVFQQRGFDTWVSMEDGYPEEYGAGKDKNQRSDYHHWLIEKGYKPNKKGNRFSRKFAAGLPIEHCKPSFLQENALEFLDKVGQQPFVMYVSFLEPHKPYTGPLNDLYDPDEITLPASFNNELGEDMPQGYKRKAARDIEDYVDEQGYRELIARYWGLVTQVDLSIKAIFDRLSALDLEDNTIVVFTSDHGSMMGAHKLVSKDVMFEESVRVPLLLKAPQLSKVHQLITERVSLVDLVPTLLDLSNTPVPDNLPGKSLVPFLSGQEEYKRDVFIEWPDIRTIITNDGWKLSLFNNDKSLLFDLNSDPFETNNLFYQAGNKEKIAELTAKIKAWQDRTNDSYQIKIKE